MKANRGFNLSRLNIPVRLKGQSFVEFAILLPVLLILFSGLIEFGFALNMYLDLVDTAREVARFTADANPFPEGEGLQASRYSEGFYLDASALADYTLGMAQQIELNTETDDVVISIFQVEGGQVRQDRIPPEFSDGRIDNLSNGGEAGWRLHGNYKSRIGSADVQQRIDRMGEIPPDTGVVLVELFYEYKMKMGFPWITAFVDNPVLMHAYTFAPNPAARP